MAQCSEGYHDTREWVAQWSEGYHDTREGVFSKANSEHRGEAPTCQDLKHLLSSFMLGHLHEAV